MFHDTTLPPLTTKTFFQIRDGIHYFTASDDSWFIGLWFSILMVSENARIGMDKNDIKVIILFSRISHHHGIHQICIFNRRRILFICVCHLSVINGPDKKPENQSSCRRLSRGFLVSFVSHLTFLVVRYYVRSGSQTHFKEVIVCRMNLVDEPVPKDYFSTSWRLNPAG